MVDIPQAAGTGTRAGVGLPRGRGRLRRSVSDGVMTMPCGAFSFCFCELGFAALRFVHPSAVRRALDVTRGRAGSGGATFLGDGGTSGTANGVNGFRMSSVGTGEATSAVVLSERSRRAGLAFSVLLCATGAGGCSTSSGETGTACGRGYGDARDDVRDLTRRGPSSFTAQYVFWECSRSARMPTRVRGGSKDCTA